MGLFFKIAPTHKSAPTSESDNLAGRFQTNCKKYIGLSYCESLVIWEKIILTFLAEPEFFKLNSRKKLEVVL